MVNCSSSTKAVFLLWRLDATEEGSDDRQNAPVVSMLSDLDNNSDMCCPAK